MLLMTIFLIEKDVTSKREDFGYSVFMVIQGIVLLYNFVFFVYCIYHWIRSLTAWHINTLRKFSITMKILKFFRNHEMRTYLEQLKNRSTEEIDSYLMEDDDDIILEINQ
jgi:hypothetical protein